MSIEELMNALEPLRKAIKEIDESNAPYREIEGIGISGTLTGYCPVQGEGHVDDHPWYFRARWDEWSFSIAENKDEDPVNVRWGQTVGWYFEGDYPNASWMEYKDANEIIKACIERFRAGEGYTNPNILEKE